jgi:hypothetical protein
MAMVNTWFKRMILLWLKLDVWLLELGYYVKILSLWLLELLKNETWGNLYEPDDMQDTFNSL